MNYKKIEYCPKERLKRVFVVELPNVLKCVCLSCGYIKENKVIKDD